MSARAFEFFLKKYIISIYTDNNNVSEVLVYLTAVGFFIAVFPVHFFNYVYVTTEQPYASLNISIFRLIPILNVNTVKNSMTKMSVNGKEKKMDKSFINKNALKVFNNLCITKIIQVADFGLKSEKNVYIALCQTFLTNAAYSFVKINGGKTKLKNYTLLNYEHENIVYYMKLVGIINLLTIGKIFTILILEKLYELKIKKNA